MLDNNKHYRKKKKIQQKNASGVSKQIVGLGF